MAQQNSIMIVDDNPIDQILTSYILKTDYAMQNITLMSSVEAAIAYLDIHLASMQVLPRLIILDLDMPGLNGFDFIERFSKYNEVVRSACKIAVLTWSDVSDDLEKIKANVHVAHLINKPIQKQSFAVIV